jgi:hypothetical protein
MKWAVNKKLHFEVGLIKAIQVLGEANLDDVIAMVNAAAASADGLGAGVVPARATATAAPIATTPPAPAKATPARETPVSAPAPVETPRREAAAPAPAAAPAAPPRIAGTLSGEALWLAARDALIEAKPLFETWLTAASFVSHEAHVFMIGFPPEQRFFRESLTRYEKDIQDQINVFAASPVRLEIVVRADIAAVEMPDFEDVEETPPAAAAPVIEATPGPEPTVEEPVATAEDFKSDPLIREALDAFEARIIKS